MKRQYLTATALGLSMLFSLNSCINKDYDWDNLNKEITIQIGSVPLGNVSPIRIDSLLESNIKSETKFTYDDAGYVSLIYKDTLDIDIPEFEMNKVEPKETKKKYDVNPQLLLELPAGEEYKIVTGESLEYKIDEPQTQDNDDWEINIQKVVFESSEVYIELFLNDIIFPPEEYTVDVDMTFPEAVSFSDHKNVTDKRNVSFTIDASELNETGTYKFGPLAIDTFSYTSDEDILYSVSLNKKDVESGEMLTAGDPETGHKFYMVIHTDNLIPSIVYASANFEKNIDGEINDMDALEEIFQDGDNFTLNRSQMDMQVTTNLGFDLKMFIDKFSSAGGTEDVLLNKVTGQEGMYFKAPDKFETVRTNYLISSQEIDGMNYFYEKDLNKLIETKPQSLAYEITAKTAIPYEEGFFLYENSVLDAEYTFTIPFDFQKIQVSFEETLKDVFSDDIADKLFNNEGEFIIAADDVIIQLGGGDPEAKATVTIGVTVYDYNDNEISLDIKTSQLRNESNELEIVIPITKAVIPQMKNAKHLGFNFRIEGTNMKLNKSDHITINKLKFKTTGGISWEL